MRLPRVDVQVSQLTPGCGCKQGPSVRVFRREVYLHHHVVAMYP